MIYHNTIVTQDAAYKENTAIIPFTQRISLDQPQHYWQQANQEIHLSKQFTPNKFYKQAIYIGRIPLHFGHFLIEGLPKMSDLPFLDLPFIGYLTRGNLPPETNTLKESEARKLINLISKNQFIEIETNDQIKVDQLFFSKPPLTISHTVHDPQKMSKLIKHITTECHKIHNIQPIDTLYLNRIDEEILNISNDPNSELTLQIDKVANAKILLGKTGSNTHLSMFANNKTITNFTPRGNPYDTDRNQLLCELIRMYNE